MMEFIPIEFQRVDGIKFVNELVNNLSFSEAPQFFKNDFSAFRKMFQNIMVKLAVDQKPTDNIFEKWMLVQMDIPNLPNHSPLDQ